MKHKLWHRAAFVLLGSVAIAACDDSTDPAPTAAAIEAVTATTISGAAGQPASISPTVRVLGSGGAPAAGVVVQFRVTSGLGSVQFADVVTDANGVASAGTWTLGPHPGVQTVTATAAGAGPVVFTSNTTAGPIGKVAIVTGNNQIIDPSTAVPINPSVRVTDAFNAPIANAAVTFTVLTGGGTIAGATSTTVATNAAGIATAGSWVLGPVPGPNTLRAQAGAVTVTFSATAEGPCDRQPVVTVGTPINGSLGTDDCIIDGVARKNFQLAVTAGQAVLVEMSSAAFNTFLNLSTTGRVPLARDADSGPGTNSVFRFIPATTGTVVIGAGATLPGSTGDFTLTVTTTTSASDGCGPPTYLQFGASTAQTIALTDCGSPAADEFWAFIPANTNAVIAQASAIDAYLVVTTPAGATVEVDNFFLNATEALTITGSATSGGFYFIRATSWGIWNDDVTPAFDLGPYTLTVGPPSAFRAESIIADPSVSSKSAERQAAVNASK